MIKFLVILFLFLFVCIPIEAKTLKGGVSFSVDTARNIAFNNIELRINIEKYNKLFIDPSYQENTKFSNKNKHSFRDRYVTKFSNNNYVVRYKNEKDIGYFYNSDGKLQFISFLVDKSKVRKHVKYNKYGELDSIILDVAGNQQFIFDINKKLYAHWVGNNCYNEKGELIDTRN